jgi:hypothetical protein
MNYFIMEVIRYESKSIAPFYSVLTTCDNAEKAIKLQKLYASLHKEKNPSDNKTEFWIVSKVEVTTGFTDETKEKVA